MLLSRRIVSAVLAPLALVGASVLVPKATFAADAKAAPITLKVSESKLGRIMTDGEGLTLYMFTPDSRNVSVCEDRCLAAWPPLMLKAGQTIDDVKLENGLRRSKLGVAMRFDGSRQVTYDGWPLYYWFRDAKAGDTTGQWVGNVWFVLTETGNPSVAR
jgi:predicted lipoprotein with Yx(FWY)xxD motif